MRPRTLNHGVEAAMSLVMLYPLRTDLPVLLAIPLRRKFVVHQLVVILSVSSYSNRLHRRLRGAVITATSVSYGKMETLNPLCEYWRMKN